MSFWNSWKWRQSEYLIYVFYQKLYNSLINLINQFFGVVMIYRAKVDHAWNIWRCWKAQKEGNCWINGLGACVDSCWNLQQTMNSKSTEIPGLVNCNIIALVLQQPHFLHVICEVWMIFFWMTTNNIWMTCLNGNKLFLFSWFFRYYRDFL